jgi:uncharacterized membrane protein
MSKTLDELDFKLILDDKKFNTQVQKDLKLAKELNQNLSSVLNLKQKINGLSKAEYDSLVRAEKLENLRKLNIEKQATAAAKRRTEEAKETEILEHHNELHSRRNRLLSEAGALATSYFSIMGAERLVKNFVRVSSEFELQKTTLRAILQDAGGADAIFEQIKGLAVVSPFSFKELVTYTKQLSAYSVPIGELYETTKMLADVSAGLGVGMDRLVLAYGQVRSAAFLRGQEIRQFTEAGIPILDELAKQFGEIEGRLVSVGEVFDKISARQVPFEMVAKVFKEMTSDGGKFYNMQEIQAETLKGKISNLKDAYEIMFSEIGNKMSPMIKGLVDSIRRLISNYEDVGKELMVMIATYGLARTATVVYELATHKLTVAQTALAKALKKVYGFITKNPYVALAVGVAALVGSLYKAITAQDEFTKATEKTSAEFANAVATETAELDFLYAKLRSTTEGTQEYDAAKKQLYSKFGKYIQELQDEGVAVNNLTTVYEALKTKVEEAAKARFQLIADKNIEEAFSNTIENIYNGTGGQAIYSFKRLREELDLTASEAQAAWGYITGDISKSALESMDDYASLLQKINKGYVSLGPGSSGPKKAVDFIDILIKGVNNAKNSYIEAKNAMSELYETASNGGGNGGNIALPKFVQQVQDILGGDKDNNPFKGLWADEYTQYSDYLDGLKKRYAELTQQISLAGNAQSDYVQNYKDELEMIKKIASKFDIPNSTNIYDYVTGKSQSSGGRGSEKSPVQIEIERQINLVKELKDAYEDLSPYVSDDKMAEVLSGLFSNSIKEGDKDLVAALGYEKKLIELAKELAKYDPEASARTLLSMGAEGAKDLVTSYKEAYDRMKAYSDFMDNWSGVDFGLEGSGIMYDLRKIAADLSSKYSSIEEKGKKARELLSKAQGGDEKALKAVRIKYGEEFWKKYVEQGSRAIDELVEKEKNAARVTSQEKLNDLAQKYVKEELFTNDIDLSDLSQKTLLQLRSLRKKLQDELDKKPLTLSADVQQQLKGRGVDVSKLFVKGSGDVAGIDVDLEALFEALEKSGNPLDEATKKTLNLIKALQKAGVQVDDFGVIIEKVLKGKLSDLTKEEAKAAAQLFDAYISDFKTMFSSISEYADEAGNKGLKSLANGFNDVMDVLGPIADRLMQGDWIGAIVSGVTTLVSKIFEALTLEEKLANAIAKAATQQRILNAEKALEAGVDGSFGTDSLRAMINAYDEAGKAATQCAEDVKKANEKLKGGSGNDSNGAATAIGVGAGAALGAAIGVWFFGIGALIGAAIGAGVGAIVGATVDIVNEVDNYSKSLQDMASEIGADLIDATTGYFNVDALKAIKETYSDLDAESQQLIDNLIANAEIFNKAVEALADSMSEIFGDVADDIADSLITAFKESGEAALDYADIIDGVASTIAKMVIKSALLQSIFDEDLAKKVAAKIASGKTDDALQIVDEAMQKAQQIAPQFQTLLDGMAQYFKMGSEASSSMSEGIKSITEDTADLLASYVNAIRADVAYGRIQRDNILAQLGRIIAMLPSTPKLSEYLAQIQANTFNTAQNTAELLERIDSVMCSDGGLSAIRVYM